MKVVSLIGARPQFIKEAVFHQEVIKTSIQEIIVHSGQHYDKNMTQDFITDLAIRQPDYNLAVGSGSHAEMTAKILIAFDEILIKENPALIIIFGDTNTALAGMLAAVKRKIPIAHVEAGVRSSPKDLPEEINRVLIDRVSSLLFCATELNKKNLNNESIHEGVIQTGDLMFDLFVRSKPNFRYDIIQSSKLKENEFFLLTLHRDYNVDSKERLECILKEITKISRQAQVVFPVHPRTKKRIQEFGLDKYLSKCELFPPLGYLDLMGLVDRCFMVITDSGGLQKESYFAGKRALLLTLDATWPELTSIGANQLGEIKNLSQQAFSHFEPFPTERLFGDGTAGLKMVHEIQKFLSK